MFVASGLSVMKLNEKELEAIVEVGHSSQVTEFKDF